MCFFGWDSFESCERNIGDIAGVPLRRSIDRRPVRAVVIRLLSKLALNPR